MDEPLREAMLFMNGYKLNMNMNMRVEYLPSIPYLHGSACNSIRDREFCYCPHMQGRLHTCSLRLSTV